jgi:hypothetical protein
VKRGRWSGENTSSYSVATSFSYFFLLLSFYLTVIIATPFDNSDDSFVDIDDFDLEDEGANVRELDNNNTNLTLPLLNTPLETIEEEEEDNGPELGLKLKKGWRGTRILTIK